MKMYLISDNVDTWTGMRLAGVEGCVVHGKDELQKELDKVMADKEVGMEPAASQTLSPPMSMKPLD